MKKKKSSSNVPSCARLSEILASTCSVELNEETYNEFQTKYMNQFFESILRQDQSCLGGKLEIAIREPKQDVFDDFRITSFKVDSEKCNLLDLVVIPVSTFFAPYNFSRAKTSEQIKNQYDQLNGQGHFTVLIVNKNQREIEYFETNGSEVPWLKVTEEAIRTAFQRAAQTGAIPPGWETFDFIWPGQFCPNVAWQGLAQTQTCTYWGTLFAVLRVNCLDVSRQELVNSILDQGKAYLLQLLQAWHCYMWNYASQHHILQVPKILERLAKNFDKRDRLGGAFGAFSQLDRNTQIGIGNKIIESYNEASKLYWDQMDADQAYSVIAAAVKKFNVLNVEYKRAYGDQGTNQEKRLLQQHIDQWID